MKIIRNNDILTEADNAQNAIKDAAKDAGNINPDESTQKIADTIQKGIVATDGTMVSDANAKSMADAVKKAANMMGNGTKAAVAPSGQLKDNVVDVLVKSQITDMLDMLYENAKDDLRHGRAPEGNLLIVGLPGSGKTAIVTQWARAHNLRTLKIRVQDPNLEISLNGMPMRDNTKKDSNSVTKVFSNSLDYLDDPDHPGILFADELNRQKNMAIRGSLLTLIQNHTIQGEVTDPDGTKHAGDRLLRGMLFTVAAINPEFEDDAGIMPLDDAERDRFFEIEYNSNPEDSAKFFKAKYDKLLQNLNPLSGNADDKKDFLRYSRERDLALFIVNDPNFTFDTVDSSRAAFSKTYSVLKDRILSNRSLSTYISQANGHKDRFLMLIQNASKFSDDIKKMFKDILSNYREKSDDEYINDYKFENNISDDDKTAAQAKAAAVNTGKEDDDDLFTHKTSNTPATAKPVSGAAKSAMDALDDILSQL